MRSDSASVPLLEEAVAAEPVRAPGTRTRSRPPSRAYNSASISGGSIAFDLLLQAVADVSAALPPIGPNRPSTRMRGCVCAVSMRSVALARTMTSSMCVIGAMSMGESAIAFVPSVVARARCYFLMTQDWINGLPIPLLASAGKVT